MDDDEEDVPTCPLCLEELDATDRAVRACQCGYQLCLLCLNYIREQANPRCPACRTPYEEQNFHIEAVNPEQAAKEAKERKTAKKERERREKMKELEKERARAMVLSLQKAKNNLKHARILQRNLVYIIGLSLTLAREEVIRRVDMFGKFGRMMRIMVNRSHPFNADAPGGPSISAYVQYVRDSDALSAVRAMNNAVFDGREIRCAIATTKYCDSLLRNAQSSDPSGTFHCGNTQCMYYHSTTHSEPVLTKEEVLARQLGPPPPSHLFQAPSSRRPHFMPNPRAPQPSLPGAPGSSAMSRPLPSRPQINPPSSAPIIHPPSGPLANSFVLGTTDQANFTAPAPTSPTLSSGAVPRMPSFQRSPPLSPEIRRPPNRMATSPNFVDPVGSTTSTGIVGSASSAAVSANSSAAWASTQPGHPITRTPTRRSPTPTDDPARPRLSVPRRARADAPPGFESAKPSRPQAAAPLRPPGFDTPAAAPTGEEPIFQAPKEIKTSVPTSPIHQNNLAIDSNTAAPGLRRENGKTTGAISPPPGFGPAPKVRQNVQEESTEQTAAAWSQEASTDQVFSGSERRPTSAVGQVGARNSAGPAPQTPSVAESPAELAKVLASIGGSLGVSSELRTVQTGAAQAVDPLVKRQGGPPVPISPKGQPNPHVGQLGPTFAGISHSQSSSALPSGVNYSTHAPPSPPAGTPNRSLDGMSPRPVGDAQSRIPPAYLRAHVPPGMRRNTSRFGFARDESQTSSPKASVISSSVTFPNLLGKTTGLNATHAANPVNTEAVVPTAEMIGLNVSQSPGAVAAASRQTRSRFMFADRVSPIRDDPGIEENVEIKLGPTPDGALGQGSGGMRLGDAFGESFANLSTEEKLQSIFTSAKWAPDSLPPMPQFNSQVDEIMQTGGGLGTNVARREPADIRGGTSARLASLTTAGRGQVAVGGGPRTRGRPVQSPPPGFRGATPGFSPETTAADKTSASTGVATKVVSGGTLSKNSKLEMTSIQGEEVGSSGAESVEDDAKKHRAQRKRDRRDRKSKQQVKHGNERNTGKSNAGGTDASSMASVTATTGDADTGKKGAKPDVKEWRVGSKGKAVLTVKEKSDAPHPVVESTVAVSANGLAAEARDGANNTGGMSRGDKDGKGGSAMEAPVDGGGNVEAELRRTVVAPLRADDAGRMEDGGEVGKFMSVSELEREVEAARVREAQLQDKLLEITRRLRSYDNVRT